MADRTQGTLERSGKRYRKVSPTMFKFENEGDEIEGVLMHVDEIIMDNGSVKRYTVQTEDGEPVSFLGSANLDLSLATVAEGQEILIRFVERRVSAKNRPVKAFDVFVVDS